MTMFLDRRDVGWIGLGGEALLVQRSSAGALEGGSKRLSRALMRCLWDLGRDGGVGG
jgi:hypothetical protein